MPSTTPSTPIPQLVPTSLNAQLLEAVIRGDEHGVRSLLERGADVNAADAKGRSAVACAIAGESWQTADPSIMTGSRLDILRLLVEDRHVSLYTLNAPQEAMNGVTPLGFAAWMNSSNAVKTLLEASGGTVSVDGEDAYGVTPLMYAARDGNLEVAKCLLLHGACPDHRDRNSRTSIQYALNHPQILWACEEALRHYRSRDIRSENGGIKPDTPVATPQPPAGPCSNSVFLPTMAEVIERTDALVSAIVSSDMTQLYGLLSGLSIGSSSEGVLSLVNAPDAEAWSPIHYCASLKQPSIEVLDILYCAGADVSLFSKTGNYTPLHCLARRKRGPDALRDQASNDYLYRFVLHLVRNLRAPLQALDDNDETCVHIAAEHGDSAEILRAMLDSDPEHTVSEMRNSRGLTPFEVAQPEFRSLFSRFQEERRPASSASHDTVRPRRSFGSDPSLSLAEGPLTPQARAAALSPLPDDDGSPLSFELVVDSLNAITMGLSFSADLTPSEAALDHFDAQLSEASTLSRNAISKLYSRVDDAREEISRVRESWTDTDARLDTISQAFEEKLKSGRVMSQETRAEDSSCESVVTRRSSSEAETPISPGFATELLMLDSSENGDGFLKPWPRTRDSADTANLPLIQGGNAAGSIAHLRSHKSMSDLRRLTPILTQDGFGATPKPRKRARADTLTDVGTKGGQSRQPPGMRADGDGKGARLKAWLRRTFLQERMPRSSTQKLEEPPSSLTTLVEKDESAAVANVCSHPSYRVLATVGKDLARIDECISKAEKLISSAQRAIGRAERKMRRASLAGKKLIYDHRRARTCVPNNEEVTMGQRRGQSPPTLRVIIPRTESPVSSSRAQSPATTRSSISSVGSVGKDMEIEDEVEKMERRFEEGYKEMDKAKNWLGIVKRVLEDVERLGLDKKKL
ncbi:hypothetical protein H4582DRAFT_1943729 [Lactarius indigo]|nr:hypothetical protein H4582DRAFT_1943729 [Lactarius indigo]